MFIAVKGKQLELSTLKLVDIRSHQACIDPEVKRSTVKVIHYECAGGVGIHVDKTAKVSQLPLGCKFETGEDKNLCGRLTDGTAADIISYLRPSDRVHHRRHRLRC